MSKVTVLMQDAVTRTHTIAFPVIELQCLLEPTLIKLLSIPTSPLSLLLFRSPFSSCCFFQWNTLSLGLTETTAFCFRNNIYLISKTLSGNHIPSSFCPIYCSFLLNLTDWLFLIFHTYKCLATLDLRPWLLHIKLHAVTSKIIPSTQTSLLNPRLLYPDVCWISPLR